MTRFLVAAASVHTVAAAADYLADRLTADDEVVVLAVTAPGADPRDAADALNVVQVRLAGSAPVETVERTGDAAEAILAVAASRDADELVVGARRGDPAAEKGVGSTTTALLAAAERPVVVVPLPDLD